MPFKQLTVENWDEPDETNSAWAIFNYADGSVRPVTSDDFAREFLSIELGDQVPAEIRDLFAVARGTMLYGWFFYPLYRLGEEQLRRVADAASEVRYREIGGTLNNRGRAPSFEGRIGYLVKHHLILGEDENDLWDQMRELRNNSTHAVFQSAHPPGWSMRALAETATVITAIFEREPLSAGDQRPDVSRA